MAERVPRLCNYLLLSGSTNGLIMPVEGSGEKRALVVPDERCHHPVRERSMVV